MTSRNTVYIIVLHSTCIRMTLLLLTLYSSIHACKQLQLMLSCHAVMSCHVMSCCHVMLCHVMSYHAVLCDQYQPLLIVSLCP